MRIAQVAPLFERVPPRAYGGTERVISYLTEELIKQGHEVSLFASGDSVSQARLISAIERNIRPQVGDISWMAYHTIQMDQVAELAADFDIIHFHTTYFHFSVAHRLPTPHVTTMHGRLDSPELEPLFRRFKSIPVISISDHQRLPLPQANWQGTVYHGLPPDLYSFSPQHGDYFLFLGRVSREKGLDRAIDIATRCGKRLYIAAKVDKLDESYFNDTIKPLLNLPGVEFLGEIGESGKRELLQGATALLFPIDWPEPFGLVMIEALCCGTPVIAYKNGSVPEILDDGITGFIVNDQDSAVDAARRIDSIDRKACREAFERRFTVRHMAEDYLQLYRRLIRKEAFGHR